MGSEKEDLQTISINFHIKGARSREQLIHIERASKLVFLHETSGNQEPKHYQAPWASNAVKSHPASACLRAPTSAISCWASRNGEGNPGRVAQEGPGNPEGQRGDPAGTGPVSSSAMPCRAMPCRAMPRTSTWRGKRRLLALANARGKPRARKANTAGGHLRTEDASRTHRSPRSEAQLGCLALIKFC